MAYLEPPLLALLHRLRYLSESHPLYLVGGSVRDLLLQRPVKDLDFALPGPVLAFGKKVARALDGSFFYLRQHEDTARIVFPEGEWGELRQIDLVTLHGDTLESDLHRRDFTVNALGLDLHQPIPSLEPEALEGAVVDPLGGLNDLHRGLIRRCAPHSLPDDPLRVMRAVRLSALFGWEIEAETERQMAELAPEMSRVSTERVRDELFIMLALDASGVERALALLNRLGLSEAALRGSVASDGPEKVERLDRLTAPDAWEPLLRGKIGSYLEETLTPPRPRRALLRLALLLGDAHDAKPPPPSETSLRSRLELSTAEARFLHHSREGAQAFTALTPEEKADPVTVFRSFQRYGDAIPGALLISQLDSPAAGEEREVVERWLHAWFFERERFLPMPLLDGRDLMAAFRRPGGPWVAQLLDALQEAQVKGEAFTLEAAWDRVNAAAPDVFARETKKQGGKP